MSGLSETVDRWVAESEDHALLAARRGGYFRLRADETENFTERLLFEALDALEERITALEGKV